MTTQGPDEKHLDELLDSALAHYNEEPAPGLEHRVLTRLRTEPLPRPRFSLLGLSRQFAAAAVMLLAFGFYIASHRATPPQPPVAKASVPAPAPVHPPVLVAQKTPATVRADHSVPRGADGAVPQRAPEFPAAHPLSPEEAAMLRLVQRHPDEARSVAAIQLAVLKQWEEEDMQFQNQER